MQSIPLSIQQKNNINKNNNRKSAILEPPPPQKKKKKKKKGSDNWVWASGADYLWWGGPVYCLLDIYTKW